MNTNLSPIAETARLEAATETLAEYIGYLNSEIDAEQDKAEPNAGRIEALEHELEIVVDERRGHCQLTGVGQNRGVSRRRIKKYRTDFG